VNPGQPGGGVPNDPGKKHHNGKGGRAINGIDGKNPGDDLTKREKEMPPLSVNKKKPPECPWGNIAYVASYGCGPGPKEHCFVVLPSQDDTFMAHVVIVNFSRHESIRINRIEVSETDRLDDVHLPAVPYPFDIPPDTVVNLQFSRSVKDFDFVRIRIFVEDMDGNVFDYPCVEELLIQCGIPSGVHPAGWQLVDTEIDYNHGACLGCSQNGIACEHLWEARIGVIFDEVSQRISAKYFTGDSYLYFEVPDGSSCSCTPRGRVEMNDPKFWSVEDGPDTPSGRATKRLRLEYEDCVQNVSDMNDPADYTITLIFEYVTA
jgi:hypothetical protein